MAGPFLQLSIVSALVKLAFELLQHPSVKNNSHNFFYPSGWENINATVLRCSSSPFAIPSQITADIFGTWILKTLFQQCEYTRSTILKELSLRLLTCSQSSSSSLSDPLTVSSTTILLKTLHALVTSSPRGVIEAESDLHEMLGALSDLEHHSAGDLLLILSPLFDQCPSLVDRVVLCVRKSTFHNDAICRMSALSALLQLLNVRIKALQMSSISSSTSTSSISVDEILVLLRRFLQHQSHVRSFLYQKLVQLHRDYPFVRLITLRFLFQHLTNYLMTDEDDIYGANPQSTDCNLSVIDFSLCIDKGHNAILEPLPDLILALLMMVGVESEDDEAEEDQFGGSQRSYCYKQCADVKRTAETLLKVSIALSKKERDDFHLGSLGNDNYPRALLYGDCLLAALVIIERLNIYCSAYVPCFTVNG